MTESHKKLTGNENSFPVSFLFYRSGLGRYHIISADKVQFAI